MISLKRNVEKRDMKRLDLEDHGSLSDTGLLVERHKVSLQYNKKVRRKVPGKERFSRRIYPTSGESRVPAFRLAAFCTCLRYNVVSLLSFLSNKHDHGFEDATLSMYSDVIAVKQTKTEREIFIFSYGCVVFYNASESYETEFLSDIAPYAVNRLDKPEFEDFEFNYGEKFAVASDQVTFESDSSLEKVSVALALAQCVKLNVYEEEIELEIVSNQDLPSMLAEEGKITLSQKEISKKIGKLFIVRNDVNLHFDVLDTPEFFWEQDSFKPAYDRLFQYLEISKRVECLNTRLEIMKELFEMLAKQVENKHATRLEWIVIILILMQVVMEVLSDGFRFFGT